MQLGAQFGSVPFGLLDFGSAKFANAQPPGPSPAPTPPPAARTFSASDCQKSGGATAFVTPFEVIDYAIDWIPELSNETILTSVWAVQYGNVSVSFPLPSIQGSLAATTVWLSDGAVSTQDVVTNTITTSGGRELQVSFTVFINPVNPAMQ